VILTEQPVYLPDIGEQPAKRPVSTGVRAYLGVPLVADGRAVGVLQLDSPVVDAWSEADRELLAAAAPIVAAAIQAARAYARAASAQTHAAHLRARFSEAAQAARAARAAVRVNDRFEAERQLARVSALLDDTDPPPSVTTTSSRREQAEISTPSASR
jgi:GAF domain-containing protein